MARSKKLEALNYDGEDIISNLPNVILSHILSFLPTKEAARTSLLSKRWGYLWTRITKLEFYDASLYNHNAPETEKQKFLGLVNRILQQQISTSSMDSFTLCLSNSEIQYPSEDLNALIHHVLERKVQTLSIKGRLHNFKRELVFPCAVFNSRSLIELDISMHTSLRFPPPNCLANLQVLKFGYIKFFRDCFSGSKELMLSFPVLKVFEIVYCTFFDVNGLNMDTPMLESLVIKDPIFEERLENEWSRVDGTIKLSASGLRKFFYCGTLEGGISLSDPSTVVDVFLNVAMMLEDEQKTCVKACSLLNEFHESVKFLELGPYMIQTLATLKDDSLLRVPIFKSLVSLVLSAQRIFSLFDLLLKLLQKSPNLQTLEFHSAKFGTSLPRSKDVPHCIQYNLKVVKIAVQQWDEDKFRFTKYVLENARILDRLTIINLKAGVRNVIKELRSIPKASSSAQIKGRRMTSKEGDEFNAKYRYPLFWTKFKTF